MLWISAGLIGFVLVVVVNWVTCDGRQGQLVRQESEQAFRAGELAFQEGKGTEAKPDRYGDKWVAGWEAAKYADELRQEQEEERKRHEAEQELRKEEQKRREEERKAIWLECRRHLINTYYKSYNFRKDHSDWQFIYRQVQEAPDNWQREMQQKLLTGLSSKMERDQYSYVKQILSKHGLTTESAWSDLRTESLQKNWTDRP